MAVVRQESVELRSTLDSGTSEFAHLVKRCVIGMYFASLKVERQGPANAGHCAILSRSAFSTTHTHTHAPCGASRPRVRSRQQDTYFNPRSFGANLICHRLAGVFTLQAETLVLQSGVEKGLEAKGSFGGREGLA